MIEYINHETFQHPILNISLIKSFVAQPDKHLWNRFTLIRRIFTKKSDFYVK